MDSEPAIGIYPHARTAQFPWKQSFLIVADDVSNSVALDLATPHPFGQPQHMEPERRSPYPYRAVWLGLALLIAALFLLWLASPKRSALVPMGVSFTPPRCGHMGNFYSGHFLIALVTNTTPWSIDLENAFLQWDVNGVIVTETANLWGGTNYTCSLEPGEVMLLPLEVPTNSPMFKISFRYNRDAGPFVRMLSPTFRMLCPRTIGPRQPFLLWMADGGWLEGRVHMKYEGEWQTNRW